MIKTIKRILPDPYLRFVVFFVVAVVLLLAAYQEATLKEALLPEEFTANTLEVVMVPAITLSLNCNVPFKAFVSVVKPST